MADVDLRKLRYFVVVAEEPHCLWEGRYSLLLMVGDQHCWSTHLRIETVVALRAPTNWSAL